MDDELYHYGIKGMKWGIRRTRAELGYDTTPKRKKSSSSGVVKSTAKKAVKAISNAHAARKQKKAEKKAHDAEVKKTQKNKKKKLSELTDDELQQRIRRMELERRYRDLTPKETSAGKQFVSNIGKQVIAPALMSTSRQLLEKQLRKAMGLDGSNQDPLKGLRDEVDELRLKDARDSIKESINNRKNGRPSDPLSDLRAEVEELNLRSKKATYENNIDKQEREKADRNNKPSGNDGSSYDQPRSSSSNTSSGRKWANDVIEVVDYTVEDVDTGSSYVRGLLGSGDDYRRRYR